MLVWGSGGVTQDLGIVDTQRCASCQTLRSFRLRLQYRYGHVWYVFKWVKEKQYSLTCDECHNGRILEARKIEPTLKESPIPFFTRYGWAFLLGLVAVLVGLGPLQAHLKEKEDYTFLAAPRAGDLYVTDIATLMKEPRARHMWGVLRARAVSGDAVEFEVSEGYYDRPTGASNDVSSGKARAADYFDHQQTLSIPTAELKQMRERRDVYEVVRP